MSKIYLCKTIQGRYPAQYYDGKYRQRISQRGVKSIQKGGQRLTTLKILWDIELRILLVYRKAGNRGIIPTATRLIRFLTN